jgi:hypothetical protein
MLVRADGMPRTAWALKDARTGVIVLTDLCDEQCEAQELRRQQAIHQPQRGHQHVVPVIVTISEAKE